MHGLNTIKRLNAKEQEFVDHILATPYKDVNLLEVWREFKKEKEQNNEPVQVSTD